MSLAAVRERLGSGSNLRVAENSRLPGMRFSGTTHRGTVYVLAGACQFRFAAGTANLCAGSILEHEAGHYDFEVVGDEVCELAHAWDLEELLSPPPEDNA
jgi:hypothetical protein